MDAVGTGHGSGRDDERNDKYWVGTGFGAGLKRTRLYGGIREMEPAGVGVKRWRPAMN